MASVDPIDLDDHAAGWVVEQLDVGLPTPHEASHDRGDDDGTIDHTARVGARAITATVRAVRGPSRLQDLLARLAPYLAAEARPTATLTTDDGTERTITVRLASDFSAPWERPGDMSLTIGFRTVGWPYLLGHHHGMVLAPGVAGGGGVVPPLTPPVVLEPSSQGRAHNAGEVAAVWQATVLGPAEDLSLRCDTTGERLDLTGLSLAAGQTLHIDSYHRAVTVDGETRWGAVDPSTSTWWRIPSGESVIRMAASSSAAPAQVHLTWHDTYRI